MDIYGERKMVPRFEFITPAFSPICLEEESCEKNNYISLYLFYQITPHNSHLSVMLTK